MSRIREERERETKVERSRASMREVGDDMNVLGQNTMRCNLEILSPRVSAIRASRENACADV